MGVASSTTNRFEMGWKEEERYSTQGPVSPSDKLMETPTRSSSRDVRDDVPLDLTAQSVSIVELAISPLHRHGRLVVDLCKRT
jgi:hypothetical protein